MKESSRRERAEIRAVEEEKNIHFCVGLIYYVHELFYVELFVLFFC